MTPLRTSQVRDCKVKVKYLPDSGGWLQFVGQEDRHLSARHPQSTIDLEVNRKLNVAELVYFDILLKVF